jgi:hypothetical protein
MGNIFLIHFDKYFNTLLHFSKGTTCRRISRVAQIRTIRTLKAIMKRALVPIISSREAAKKVIKTVKCLRGQVNVT